MLDPDDPDYEFPKEVHNLLVAAYEANWHLSGMADNKASILMGASFVVFSMSIGDIAEGKATLPLLVLTFSRSSRPFRGAHRPYPIGCASHQDSDPPTKINILFFGSYTNASREDYIDEVDQGPVVGRGNLPPPDRATSTIMACVLRDDKFSWLYWSFTLFLFGMVRDRSARSSTRS